MEFITDDGVVFSYEGKKMISIRQCVIPHGHSGVVEIPKTINGIPVKKLFSSVFGERLIKLIIPEGVTEIHRLLFLACPNLTSIELPASVVDIEHCAFSHCPKLNNYYVDEANPVYQVVNGFLVDKSEREVISAPKNVREAKIPNGVVSIGNEAFKDCAALRTIQLPESVLTIRERAFLNCKNLQAFVIDEKNEAFQSINGMLLNKSGTTLISVPTGVTSVEVPHGVTEIADGAFVNCTAETIALPATLTEMTSSMFWGCEKLLKFVVDEGNPAYYSQNGMLIERSESVLVRVPKNVSSVVVPNGIKKIGSRAFSDCRKLKSINLPIGITVIKGNAFAGCVNLHSINLPQSLVELGEFAFACCIKLKSVSIPAHVKYIGECAFSASDIETITVDDENECYRSVNGLLLNKEGTKLLCIPGGMKEAIIPESVKEMDELAGNHSILQSVIIPSSMTALGNTAFFGCNSLKSVSLPSNMSEIGVAAFMDCQSLPSIELPKALEQISEKMFTFCYSLKSIVIPNDVKSIGKYAFWNCKNLTSVTIPRSVTKIDEKAFAACDSLTEVLIATNNEIENSDDLTKRNKWVSQVIPKTLQKLVKF